MPHSRSALTWYLCAVVCAVFIGSPGPVYWDSLDYVTHALTGYVGGLGVGRPVFALATHGVATVWQLVGGSVWDLEPALRLLVILVSAFSAPLTWRLALEAGLTVRAAGFSAAFVAASPAFAHTSASVLTDGPAVPLVLLTWIATMRALRSGRRADAAVAGLWFGLAIGVREASVLAGLTCAAIWWSSSQSARGQLAAIFAATTALVVILPMGWLALTQPGYVDTIATWLNGMAHDRAMKSWTWQEAGVIAGWIVALAPVAVIVLLASWRSWRRRDPRASGSRDQWRYTLAIPAWIQWGVMATSMGVSYSPRYLLTAFPAALAIPAGWVLDYRLPTVMTARVWVALVLTCATPLIVGRTLVRTGEAPALAVIRALPALLRTLPSDAVIVTGHACPAVAMIRVQTTLEPREGQAPPAWTTVCPGWSWPADLAEVLDAHRASGRTVVLDLRDDAWRGAEQRRSLEQVRAYWTRHGSRSADGLVGLQ